MKHSIVIFWLGILLFGLQPNAQSQDPFYSQIFANRLQLSPALAGSEVGPGFSITTQARWQWIGIENHLQQYGAAYHQTFYALGLAFGYGLNYQLERTADGGFTQNKLDFHFSHKVELVRNHFLLLGMAAGIQQQALDFSVLRFPPQIINGQLVPSPPINSVGQSYRPDFQAGLTYYSEHIFAVMTVKHLQDIKFEDATNPFPGPFYSATMGIKLALRDSLLGKRRYSSLSPFVHYQRQGPYYIAMIGMNLEVEMLSLSIRYGIKNRWSGGIAFRRGPFQLAYHYDHFVGNLNQESFGQTHELSLKCVLDTGPPNRKIKMRLMPLPKF
ncbi:MAG: PorP/SprF family type IX secretion system membrane protein [Bacteroidota bacterium]